MLTYSLRLSELCMSGFVGSQTKVITTLHIYRARILACEVPRHDHDTSRCEAGRKDMLRHAIPRGMPVRITQDDVIVQGGTMSELLVTSLIFVCEYRSAVGVDP